MKKPKEIVKDMISNSQLQTSGNYAGSQYDLGGPGEDKAKKRVETFYPTNQPVKKKNPRMR